MKEQLVHMYRNEIETSSVPKHHHSNLTIRKSSWYASYHACIRRYRPSTYDYYAIPPFSSQMPPLFPLSFLLLPHSHSHPKSFPQKNSPRMNYLSFPPSPFLLILSSHLSSFRLHFRLNWILPLSSKILPRTRTRRNFPLSFMFSDYIFYLDMVYKLLSICCLYTILYTLYVQ